jgi:hypothetical protein
MAGWLEKKEVGTTAERMAACWVCRWVAALAGHWGVALAEHWALQRGAPSAAMKAVARDVRWVVQLVGRLAGMTATYSVGPMAVHLAVGLVGH